MYEGYFDFAERPFSIAPDPRFLFLSERHREALAHLVYGLNDAGGFVLLTGEVGTGKTTLCRSLLAQVPENVDVAFVLNPLLDPVELLQTVCEELHITAAGAGIKQLVDRINAHLLERNAAGRSTVLLIDEAQNLSTEVLEQLRLLTNLETNERKLLRIILIGQPELAEKLARPELRQLAQRITARYHLEALQAHETAAYVEHRLQVAGAKQALFQPQALRALHREARGIPRLINVIADRTLLGAYAQGRRDITPQMVRKASREVSGAPRGLRGASSSWFTSQQGQWAVAVGTALAVALGGLGAWALLRDGPAHAPDAAASVVATPPVAPALAPPAAATPARSDAYPDAATSTDTGGEPILIEPPPEAIAAARADAGAPPPAAGNTNGAQDTAVTARNLLPPWPEYMSREESTTLAFATLYNRWRSPFDASGGVAPCDYAKKVGLACLRGRGDWALLGALDRPAVLRLYDAAGGAYAAALVALRPGTADVVIAERTYRVPERAVQAQWRGEYTVLWQLPPEYRGPIGPGAKGASVAWLREQLQTVTGEPLPGGSHDGFDDALAKALAAWQSAQGLAPDGRAGARTWIALHDASGMPAPHLSTQPSAASARARTAPPVAGRAAQRSAAPSEGMSVETADDFAEAPQSPAPRPAPRQAPRNRSG